LDSRFDDTTYAQAPATFIEIRAKGVLQTPSENFGERWLNGVGRRTDPRGRPVGAASVGLGYDASGTAANTEPEASDAVGETAVAIAPGSAAKGTRFTASGRG
jgi:hypothetical protein